MKKLKIYLAGRMSGLTYEEMNQWRVNISKIINHMADYHECIVDVVNPVSYYNFQNPRHQNEREVMMYDLAHVKSSNIIVVKLDGLNNSIGSCIELYEAYKNDIPVIALGTDEEYEKLHPWIRECITRYEKTDDEVSLYISEFYMT